MFCLSIPSEARDLLLAVFAITNCDQRIGQPFWRLATARRPRLHSVLHAEQTVARRSCFGFLRANLGRHIRSGERRARRRLRNCLHSRAFRAGRSSNGDFLPALLRGITGKALWAGAQIGFCMFTADVFQTAGLKYTTPSKAAFITGSSVVIVPLLLAGFGRRRINVWIWAGALAALVGLYFLDRAAGRL